MRKLAFIGVALVLAVSVAGCGTAAAHQLPKWCSLKIGNSQSSVTAKMGKPAKTFGPGSGVDGITLPSGFTALEWRIGRDILLATFVHGRAFNLQAYAGSIGPRGARGIGCRAFRSS